MNKNITKILSVMLVAIMIVLMIPFATSAASDAEQITSLDQLTTGKYVIATDKGYAMGVIDGTWVSAQKVTATNGKITGVADSLLWEVTVSGSSVTLKDNNGTFLAPAGGNKNGITTKSYKWDVSVTNGKFVFAGTGSDTVYLASNATEQYANKFRGYKTSTAKGDSTTYPYQLCVYKVSGTSAAPETTVAPVTTTAPVTTAAPVTTKAPETTAAPVVPETPATDSVVLSVSTLGLASDSYAAGTKTVGGTSFEFVQMGNYGDGLQMRDKNGNTSSIWNTSAFAAGIAKIELVYSDSKDVAYSNADAVIFTFGNEAQGATYTTKLSTTAGEKTYTITPDAETYTFFKLEHDLGYTMYWKSITIVFADGTTVSA